jgi:hypothetical protein
MGGIERGEHNLTMMNFVKIADALKVKPSHLLEVAVDFTRFSRQISTSSSKLLEYHRAQLV